MFTVYLTIYLGNSLPPFYIGSTTFKRLSKGYHGSVTSIKYGDIWKYEIKNNPQLFITVPIPGQTANTATEILDLELAWQKEFDVARNPRFINQCLAKKGFCHTKESARKAVETRKRNGTNIQRPETRRKISESNKGTTRPPLSLKARQKISKANTGRVISPEWRAKISNSNTGKKASEETIAKLRESHLGNIPSPESIAKRLATIEANGGYRHSEETKKKIGDAQRGKPRKGFPCPESTKQKLHDLYQGKTRDPAIGKKCSETAARKRAEQEQRIAAGEDPAKFKKKHPSKTCPHCGTTGLAQHIARYHNNHCKLKKDA